jgi:hypothetical protein
MKEIIKKFQEYLRKMLDLQIKIEPILHNNELPFFLINSYEIYKAIILNKHYILAVSKDSKEFSPSQIAKHMETFEKILKSPCIYVANHLPSYNRQRLIKHKVSFVIPEIQLYLPTLGLIFNKTSEKKAKTPSLLTPSAQAIVIYVLINYRSGPFTPSKLATILSYSNMTMSRAIKDFTILNFGETTRQGKEQLFRFYENGYSLWKQVLPYLQSPVKDRIWIKTNSHTKIIQKESYISGLSALSLKSSIISPSKPIYAIYYKLHKIKPQLNILPIEEGSEMQIEYWNYNPSLFADKKRIIDDFSLYLSFKNCKDERIEKALDNLMENKKW